jgi:hypothetical protein
MKIFVRIVTPVRRRRRHCGVVGDDLYKARLLR